MKIVKSIILPLALVFLGLVFLPQITQGAIKSQTRTVSTAEIEKSIEISRAFLLDSQKYYLQDIFQKVHIKDGVYAAIKNGHYIKITFEELLANGNDITLFAKSQKGARIEVYKLDGKTPIAVFKNIKKEDYYKITLSNLGNPADTFYLKVTGSVDIDYITDPSTGPNSPGTTADDSGVGTVTWTDHANITSSNNGYATAVIPAVDTITHYLKATNFGFSIPAGATIDGVVVEWERKDADLGGANAKDNAIRIVKGGTIGATDKSSASTWPASDAYASYGSSSDLWGETLTESDIESSTFGAALSARNVVTSSSSNPYVDHVRITVYYTEATVSVGGTVYTDEGSTNIGANKTVAISINGAAAAGTDDTDASGVYSITGLTIAANDVITLYIDGETETGVTVTKGTGSNMTSIHIFSTYLITRCDNSCSLANTNLDTANNNGDADITAIYTGTTTITTASGKSLYIPASHTFAPANPVSVGGTFTNNGTFTHGSSTVTLTSTSSTAKLKYTGGSSFYNLTIDGSGGTYSLQDDNGVPSPGLSVDNNLTITAGTLNTTTNGCYSGGPGTTCNIKVAGNWSNSGTFTANTATVTLNGTDQTITGTTTFYNLTKQETTDNSADQTLTFTHSTIYTISNTFNLDGLDSNDELKLVSSSAGTKFTLSLTSAATANYLDVKDSQVSVSDATCTNCTNAGGNDDGEASPHWVFNSTISISGTVYTDEGSTNIGSGKTVAVSVNGAAAATTADTNGSGVYSLSSVAVVAGDVLTLYLDNETEDAVTVTVTAGSNMTNIHLFQNYLIARCDNSCSLTNANLNTANNNGDTDIDAIYTGTTTITTAAGKSLYIPSSHTFAPANPVSVGGNFSNNGTFTHGSSTLTLTGTGTQTFKTNSSSLYNLTINGSGGTYTPQDATTVGNNLVNTAGTLYMVGFAFTVTGTTSVSDFIRTATSATGTKAFTGAVTLNSGGGFYMGDQNPVVAFGAGITNNSLNTFDVGSNNSNTLIGNITGGGNNGAITWGGDLTISSGTTTNSATGVVTVTGTLILTGNWVQANGSTLTLSSTTPFSGAGTFSASTATNTVRYDGNGAFTVKDPNGGTAHTYSNLELWRTGAKTMTGITTTNDFTMRGSASTSGNAITTIGGNLTLSDLGGGIPTFTAGANLAITGSITITDGTFDANNFNITAASVSSSNSNTRTITMGSGTWTLNGTGTVWTTATATNLTLNANTSTIKVTDTSNTANTFSGGGKTYNNIWWSRGASTASNTIAGSNTFADFKDDGSVAHSILFTAGTTQTVTTFTVSGTSGNLITINSTTTGTHALVKAGGGTISRDYLNIQHSVATPSSTWYAGLNSTNNQATETAGSGWIFAAPVSIGGTVYTDEGTTNIGANKTVAISINGAAAASTDDTDASGVYSITGLTISANDVLTLYIDGETELGVTVTKATGSDQTGLHIFQNYLITRCDNSCSLTNANINTADANGDADITAIISAASDTAITTASGKSLYIPASHTFAPGGTVSVGGSWTDVGTFTHGSSTVTFASTATGKTITTTGSSFYNLTFDGVGGGWSFQDNPTIANTLTVTNGSLDANGADVTVANVSSSNSNTRTINLGTGTWTLNGTGTVWTTATTTNLSLIESTSTLAITDTSSTGKTFSGGGETFATITFSGDNITVAGSNTFSTFNLNNAGLTNGLKLTSGTTQTVTTFASNGALGSLAKLVSTSAGSAATLSKTTGTVREDYMSIQDSTATGGAIWYAGAGSNNVSGNTGWIFTAAPVSNGKFLLRGGIKFRGDMKFR